MNGTNLSGLTPADLMTLVVAGTIALTFVCIVVCFTARGQDGLEHRDDDHGTCAHDGCGLVLCHCPTVRACPGTADPGCAHPGAGTCDEHRLEVCLDCRVDAMDDAGLLE